MINAPLRVRTAQHRNPHSKHLPVSISRKQFLVINLSCPNESENDSAAYALRFTLHAAVYSEVSLNSMAPRLRWHGTGSGHDN